MSLESHDTTSKYLLDTGSELGRAQMDHLEQLLDPISTACLDEIGAGPGWRCLDLGAGGGSITRWLAERTGSTGTIVSVDLDTAYLVERPGIEVHQHDINEGLPVDGPFQLIHTRLLLMHLPRRVEILKTLVDALAPGGWLVVGEFSDRPLRVLTAPGDGDEQVHDHVLDVGHNTVARAAGVSFTWAHEVDRHMAEAGLTNRHSLAHARTTAGGTTACLLNLNYVRQLETPLLHAGITTEELGRFRDLMLDPRFRAWSYQFVCTWGQKPV
ncbi:methyltransferase domain-containing protein [Lentzea sp. NEAU-D13]|uniref:Methyltransferase domain-containing protein n=1 Tax=Lentzea alba TaxID=2714351 RepID=A0A7C9W5J6_9PSEU|nr:class I SAM-dependent methyltransferase [Lentzea alba]NGY65177.1 methyltransferase domain-containing protein [Lentzea alba]